MIAIFGYLFFVLFTAMAALYTFVYVARSIARAALGGGNEEHLPKGGRGQARRESKKEK